MRHVTSTARSRASSITGRVSLQGDQFQGADAPAWLSRKLRNLPDGRLAWLLHRQGSSPHRLPWV